MIPGTPTKPEYCKGMTLIELLIAVSVSVLVTAIVLSVYGAINASRSLQRSSRFETAYRALDAIRRDMTCAIQPTADGLAALRLASTEGLSEGQRAISSLDICTIVLNPGDPIQNASLMRAQYSINKNPGTDIGGILARVSSGIPDGKPHAASATNLLMRDVTEFRVTVFDGQTWTNRWESRPARALPKAANVTLSWATGSTSETASAFVLIPAGLTFGTGKDGH